MPKKHVNPYRFLKKNIVKIPIIVFVIALAVNLLSNIIIGSMSDVTIGVDVQLSPPENTVVTNTIPGSVDIEWDKSPSSDFGDVSSYEIYVKFKTDTNYPGTFNFERTDILDSYSDAITGLSTSDGYDFIVRAVSPNSNISPLNCASCEDTNAECGNDVKEPGEQCDGSDLNSLTCLDFGYSGGTLSCSVTCTYSYSGCSAGGGGGGGDDDTTSPSPGSADSPEYANEGPITVTYSGAYDTGGSGLSFVELWYKRGLSGWSGSGLISSGSSGSFNFNLFTTQTTYSFALVAEDNEGNRSDIPSGNGDDSTIYDTTSPDSGTADSPATSNSTPITVTYSGAEDIGGSDLKQIELWYKKGSSGTWTDSGLTSTSESGSFDFTDTSGDDTYYFDLVAEDNAENRSVNASGDGDTNTVYSIVRPTAILGNLPNNPTYLNTADITIGGDDVITYRYKLDDGTYGAETNADTNITLIDLTESEHNLYVIAKNSLGNWQLENDETEYTWVVDASIPSVSISNPSIDISNGEDVSYTLTYYDSDTITLAPDDITLNTTGDANGSVLSITSAGVDSYLVTISSIDGNGTIGISVAENTASNDNGRSADSAGPSNTFTVETYVPGCGNGITDSGEECDDGNLINGDGCSDVCEIEPYCGDGSLDSGEECDDGNLINGDGCSDVCEIEPYCGDNSVDDGEECDDGNLINGDGCSDVCEIEPYCGDGSLDSGEECDDGNLINGDGCSDVCLAEVDHCANGIIDEDEEGIDCGGLDCAACHTAAPNHCENEIRDEDELGIDCGGDDCIECEVIDVNFTAYAVPEGRSVSIGFDAISLLELNNRNQNIITNTQAAIFDSTGHTTIDVDGIAPGNYDVGINGDGYLRAVIYNIPIFEANSNIELDFTFNNVYKLIGGDVWSDNIINAGDIAQVIQTYGAPNANTDLNRDGFVNAADMALVLKNYFRVGDTYF